MFMKALKLPILLLIFSILSNSSIFSQVYVGAGAGYKMPFSKFEETNKKAMTYTFNLENRYYCKLWYGIKAEFSSPDSSDNLPLNEPYYKDFVNIIPNVRYNFLGGNCYESKIFPFLQAGLIISSIGRTDDSKRLGLGLLAGGGFSYGFTLFKHCMSLDGGVYYNLPNIIMRDSARSNIEYLNVNLTLNIKL